MALISTYPIDASVNLTDKLIGTDVEDSSKTKNYTISSILALQSLSLTSLFSGSELTNQLPSALNTPLQVKFGAAQGDSNSVVQLAANGTLTFNQNGLYFVDVYLNFERRGSSGGTSITLFRELINDVQIGPVKSVDLATTGISVPFETLVPITTGGTYPIGSTVKFQILRDSSGVNEGGLYTQATSSSWDDVPSAFVEVYRQQLT